jgi:hypothetical protein
VSARLARLTALALLVGWAAPARATPARSVDVPARGVAPARSVDVPARASDAPARAADGAVDATADARSHYEVGLRLFDAREHEQALIEFSAANELKPRPAALFMMAQCEYLLGRLKDARAHYERYATENPTGEFVELAKDRVESIDKRPSTFVINTVPDDVTVRIRAAGTPTVATDVTGQAPNNFQVPRGHYRIDVTKTNYQGQTIVVDVDIAETKPLFFKLEPIPARLEIATTPDLATLYVNGNRARNPYRQDVAPGHYEVFAEAPNHEDRTIDFTLAPGEHKLLLGPDSLRLAYVQRSGRPELIVASSLIGGFVGAGAVVAAIGSDLESPNVASVLLVSGGGIAGIIAGWVVATPLVPRYIPDNRALFVLGNMWIGVAEGAGLGIVTERVIASNRSTQPDKTAPNCDSPCRPPLGADLRAAFIGSVPGLALGLTTGALTSDHAPTYGRAAMIQSAALGGIIAGALSQVVIGKGAEPQTTVHEALLDVTLTKSADDTGTPCIPDAQQSDPSHPQGKCAFKNTSVLDLTPGALIGLNVGLALGLMAAYLPDQTKYGPTWKRVLLIDLATGAGALAGAVAGCVANGQCLDATPDQKSHWISPRALSAGAALGGGVVGFLGGYFLTRHVDDEPAPAPATSLTLAPTPMPGGLPGFTAMGTF